MQVAQEETAKKSPQRGIKWHPCAASLSCIFLLDQAAFAGKRQTLGQIGLGRAMTVAEARAALVKDMHDLSFRPIALQRKQLACQWQHRCAPPLLPLPKLQVIVNKCQHCFGAMASFNNVLFLEAIQWVGVWIRELPHTCLPSQRRPIFPGAGSAQCKNACMGCGPLQRLQCCRRERGRSARADCQSESKERN